MGTRESCIAQLTLLSPDEGENTLYGEDYGDRGGGKSFNSLPLRSGIQKCLINIADNEMNECYPKLYS